MVSYIISSTIILFDEQSISHSVSSIVILFDKQSYCFIVMFQVYKRNMLLYRKKNIIKTYIFFLVLSFYFFRGLESLLVS
jgi:hypothetical protein